MSVLFKAKIRKFGSSLAVLIPKKVVLQEKISEGEEVEVGIVKNKK